MGARGVTWGPDAMLLRWVSTEEKAGRSPSGIPRLPRSHHPGEGRAAWGVRPSSSSNSFEGRQSPDTIYMAARQGSVGWSMTMVAAHQFYLSLSLHSPYKLAWNAWLFPGGKLSRLHRGVLSPGATLDHVVVNRSSAGRNGRVQPLIAFADTRHCFLARKFSTQVGIPWPDCT